MIAFATSISVAILYIGLFDATLCFIDSYSSSLTPAALYMFVFTKDGATALTLTPRAAIYIAIDFVNISSPAFTMQ